MNRRIIISLVLALACSGMANAQLTEGRRDSMNLEMPTFHPMEASSGAIRTSGQTLDYGRIDDIHSIRLNTTNLDFRNQIVGKSHDYGALMTPLNGLTIVGGHSYDEHPFLLAARSASIGMGYHHGGLTAYVGTSAVKMTPMGFDTMNQFGVNAMVRYRFSPAVSLTAFGQYYNRVPYFNAATYAYIDTSRYGAFATFEGGRFGVNLGVQRRFDAMTGQWRIEPIVTPVIKIGRKFSIEIPVGSLISNAYDSPHRLESQSPAAPSKAPLKRH